MVIILFTLHMSSKLYWVSFFCCSSYSYVIYIHWNRVFHIEILCFFIVELIIFYIVHLNITFIGLGIERLGQSMTYFTLALFICIVLFHNTWAIDKLLQFFIFAIDDSIQWVMWIVTYSHGQYNTCGKYEWQLSGPLLCWWYGFQMMFIIIVFVKFEMIVNLDKVFIWVKE